MKLKGLIATFSGGELSLMSVSQGKNLWYHVTGLSHGKHIRNATVLSLLVGKLWCICSFFFQKYAKVQGHKVRTYATFERSSQKQRTSNM